MKEKLEKIQSYEYLLGSAKTPEELAEHLSSMCTFIDGDLREKNEANDLFVQLFSRYYLRVHGVGNSTPAIDYTVTPVAKYRLMK